MPWDCCSKPNVVEKNTFTAYNIFIKNRPKKNRSEQTAPQVVASEEVTPPRQKVRHEFTSVAVRNQEINPADSILSYIYEIRMFINTSLQSYEGPFLDSIQKAMSRIHFDEDSPINNSFMMNFKELNAIEQLNTLTNLETIIRYLPVNPLLATRQQRDVNDFVSPLVDDIRSVDAMQLS